MRALTESAGLDLAAVRAVLATLQRRPDNWAEFLGAVQSASNPASVTEPPRVHRENDVAATPEWIEQARDLMTQLGWQIESDSPLLARLAIQLRALEHGGIRRAPDSLLRYAAAARLVAETDLATVPDDPAGALRQVVLGTALMDPVLATLRRLAQQDVAMTTYPPAIEG